MSLPSTERWLFGPGPSLVTPRVMRALAAPALGHLDPQFLAIMDDLRARLQRVFQAPPDSFAFAVSGTGTAGMETAVANLVAPGRHVLVVVTGYFGARLVEMCTRYGGEVREVKGEWGRAIDPDCRRAVAERQKNRRRGHGPRRTSTGVRTRGGYRVAGEVTWRFDDCRLRHLARRRPRRYGGVGRRRVLQRLAEVPRSPFRPGADCLRAVRTRAARALPKLLSRRRTAPGLLDRPQVPPHDVLVADLRAERGPGRYRGGRARSPLDTSCGRPSHVRGTLEPWSCRCCPRRASACQTSTR